MSASPQVEQSQALLQAQDITKTFQSHGRARGGSRAVRAVSEVSLELHRERVLALVGESGCGKSTVARLLAGLYPVTSGEIRLNGKAVQNRGERARRKYASHVQIVLQDPFSSLNSAYRVRHHLIRPLKLHGAKKTDAGNLEEQAIALLEEVNLSPGRDFIDRFPHELSGGQRQRVSIARALAVRPEVLLADEPVSMLDVSIRLEMLRLLARLTKERHLALLYITHDIASARYFADDIAVMYAGEMVEAGPAEELTQNPQHPYTQLLVSAVPDPDRAISGAERKIAEGEVPVMLGDVVGCRFAGRCPHTMPRCGEVSPPRFPVGDAHWARCFLFDDQPNDESAALSAS
jgi:peptide/nickel transport system ATP-binding protein